MTALDEKLVSRRGGRGRRTVDGRFDSALGWEPGFRASNVLRFVLCGVALCVFAVPFVLVLSGAFDGQNDSTALRLIPAEPSLLAVTTAIDRGALGYFANSLVIVGGGLVCQVTIAILVSYALARHRFRGQAVAMMLFLITMMLPEEIIAIPLSQVIGDVGGTGVSLRGTPWGVILPVAVWGFSILVMTEFMKEIPREIEEAARLDGVGELRMLWTIILPLSKPVLGVVTIFGFMMIWDQYLLPLIAADTPGDYTLTVALSLLRVDAQVGTGVLLVGALLALLPSLTIYLLMQRSLIRGIASGATKG